MIGDYSPGMIPLTSQLFCSRRVRHGAISSWAGHFILCLAVWGMAVEAAQTGPPAPGDYFRISVVDQTTGRGVPCVCLRTVNRIEYWTDSGGEVAFYERDLMGHKVFFYVESYGYSYPTNAFGLVGVQLAAEPGGHAVIKVRRENIAERLYRCTGEGICRDSQLLGLPVPAIEEAGKIPVVGQDGGLMLPFRGKYMWTWGDTVDASFPLGVFKGVGATSEFPENGGLDPDVGVCYHYFRDAKGKVRPLVEADEKIVWPMAPRVALDKEGREHLLMNYCRGFQPYGGILEFDEKSGYFRRVGDLPPGNPFPYLCSAVMHYRQQGREYFGFGPWGEVRTRTDLASNLDSRTWESFTCLKEGAALKDGPGAFDRDANGRLRWAWKRNTPMLTDAEQAQLVRENKLSQEERWYRPIDVNTGADWLIHDGTVHWNAYRGRWICLRAQNFGKSLVGEVLYFEGDTPLGPWCYCQKVVTHANGPKDTYAFYGPKQHPEFDKEGGRIIYFEGAFSQAFGTRPVPIPRYDYNEIMYKLDLADPRLFLPVPVYALRDDPSDLRTLRDIPRRDRIGDIVCFAPDRPRAGTVPIFAWASATGKTMLSQDKPAGQTARVAFYALPAGVSNAIPPMTILLYRYTHSATGQRLYSTDAALAKEGYVRSADPVCRVWRTPISFNPFTVATDWEPVLSPRRPHAAGESH